MDFGSNLILNNGIVSIYNVKEIQLLVDCLKKAKAENPEFEPKNTLADKEKTDVFTSVLPTLLAWRDAFRTFDWAGLYSDLDFHLGSTNKLISLAL